MNSGFKRLDKEANLELYMEQVRFGQSEQIRRNESPVHVRAEDHADLLRESNGAVFLVDPRLGFNNRTHRFWINKLPAGGEEGQKWKTVGHRHTVEAVIYWLSGHGYSIIDGIRYDWKAGDTVCVPMFAWHRHVNESDDFAYYLASTTGPLSMGLGQAVYEDERFPQYFVFAQQGDEAMKALIPGGGAEEAEKLVQSQEVSTAQRLYAEQIGFAYQEEMNRRKSRVLMKAEEVALEPTVMGHMAYLVDPRIGFYVKALSTVMAEVAPGKHSGSHRHLYDEIDYVLEGEGKVVIDDQTYEVKQGDSLAIPIFAWHQYFCTSSKPLRLLCHSTRPAMENLGLVLTQHGEDANY
jgi:gentisate 1,2-dioxygenase